MPPLFPAFARIAGKPRIRIRIRAPQQHPTGSHAVARPVMRAPQPPRPPRARVVFRDWAAI